MFQECIIDSSKKTNLKLIIGVKFKAKISFSNRLPANRGPPPPPPGLEPDQTGFPVNFVVNVLGMYY